MCEEGKPTIIGEFNGIYYIHVTNQLAVYELTGEEFYQKYGYDIARARWQVDAS